MPEVREERTYWRDMNLSQRHRDWGFDCLAVDIDFLLLEYANGTPMALVEYKHEKAKKQTSKHPSYQAIIALGNRSSIPVFANRYKDDYSLWIVTPLNEFAKQWVAQQTGMTEIEWVSLLYEIRGYTVPKTVLSKLSVCA